MPAQGKTAPRVIHKIGERIVTLRGLISSEKDFEEKIYRPKKDAGGADPGELLPSIGRI